MLAGGVISNIVQPNLNLPQLPGPADNGYIEYTGKHFRKKSENIKAHRFIISRGVAVDKASAIAIRHNMCYTIFTLR